MTKEERLEHCRTWIKRLEGQYSQLNKDREDSIKFCNSDPSIVKVIEGRSQIVTTDMQDAIDDAMPDILEAISGTDEPLKLDPVGKEDVEPTKRLQILGNLMIRNKNPWFRLCSDFLDDSMKLKIGFFKYRWVKEVDSVEKMYEDSDDLEVASYLMEEDAQLVSDDVGEDGVRRTVVKYNTTDEYVKIEGVPAERLRFPIDTRSFDNAPFVVEEVLLYEHEFIQLYGKKAFKKVKDQRESCRELDSQTVENARFKDLGGLNFLYDEKTHRYKAYECYFPEIDEEEPWLFVFSGDEVLVNEKNRYRKPPYRGGSPFLLAHRLIGQGYIDRLKEIMRQRTDYKRMLFDWTRMGLFRRYFLNIQSNINMDDYLNHNASNAVIRVDGPIQNGDVLPEERAPLSPEVFGFWEQMKLEKDYHIPTPRSYGGVEGASDEKTFRGKHLKVTQASRKILMMIRGYMEDVFKPLFEDVLDCISIFMEKSITRRYLNEDYEITPLNIRANFDTVVNTGLGAHDKDAMIAKIQQLIALGMKQPDICTPQDRHYMMKELVKAMGFLNTTDFVTDPKMMEAIMQLIQGVMIHMNGLKQLGLQLPDEQMMMQLIQQTTQAIGMPMGQPGGGNGGGENPMGSQPGEITPEIEKQPANERNPVETIDGGGFFG